MTRCNAILLLALAALLCTTPAVGRVPDGLGVDVHALRRKQEAQERARVMARELVTGVLDVQLQQLEENGLRELQLYRDIHSMRMNISGLVEAEMSQVVALLVRAQNGDEPDRVPAFAEARQMIRAIVLRLSLERQNLRRRLETAGLAAQVKRLIELEEVHLEFAQSIPLEARGRQEAMVLGAIQDARDVVALLDRLILNLSDVSEWGGEIGEGAADGLRILQAADVDNAVASTIRALETFDVPAAVRAQKTALRGLALLLRKVEEVQGVIDSDRESTIELVRELLRRQQEARDLTATTDLTDASADSLVGRQKAVRDDIGKLSASLDSRGTAHAVTARDAASEATRRLFDLDRQGAVIEQDSVLAALARVEQGLSDASERDAAARSAEGLARRIKDLEAVRRDVAEIRRHHADLGALIASTSPSGRERIRDAERAIAARLDELDEGRDLTTDVTNGLASARDAVAALAAALDAPTGGEPPRPNPWEGTAPWADSSRATVSSRIDAAEDTLEHAAAEIEAALADARRQGRAVHVLELSKASDALERAAAVEREIASRCTTGAQREIGLAAAEGSELARRQRSVSLLAEKVAEALHTIAPHVADTIEAAKKPMQGLESQLRNAGRRTGERGRRAASEAAERAGLAATRLEVAAAQLRSQVGDLAADLAELSAEQLGSVRSVRERVDKSLASLPEAIGAALDRLERAAARVAAATREQLRAAGRADAAIAMDLADGAIESLARQELADRAAADLAAGWVESPTSAAAEQQVVADSAGDLAARARKSVADGASARELDSVRGALQQAHAAAEEGIRALLDGDIAMAELAQSTARLALERARDESQSIVRRAFAIESRDEIDTAAQRRVGLAVAEARDLVGGLAFSVVDSLDAAGSASERASVAIALNDEPTARFEQRSTLVALVEAGDELARAIARLERGGDETLRAQARRAGEIAPDAAHVDPGATAALREAESLALAPRAASSPTSTGGGVGESGSAGRSTATPGRLEHALERAAANLSAREERIRSDRENAVHIGKMVARQEDFRDEVRQRRAAASSETHDPAIDSAIDRAHRDFAAARRAADAGAAAISGQREIANEPLRGALDLAMRLGNATSADGQEDGGATGSGSGGEPGAHAAAASGTAAAESTAATNGAPSPLDGAGPAVSALPGDPRAARAETGAARAGSAVGGSVARPDRSETRPGAGGIPRRIETASWFARLPPEVRAAIRARSRSRAPRGYEEMLRRYFESID